jgi:hypothetical protein
MPKLTYKTYHGDYATVELLPREQAEEIIAHASNLVRLAAESYVYGLQHGIAAIDLRNGEIFSKPYPMSGYIVGDDYEVTLVFLDAHYPLREGWQEEDYLYVIAEYLECSVEQARRWVEEEYDFNLDEAVHHLTHSSEKFRELLYDQTIYALENDLGYKTTGWWREVAERLDEVYARCEA